MGRWNERLKPKTVVYYESIKRKLVKRLILEYRCDARLKAKAETSTRLALERTLATEKTK